MNYNKYIISLFVIVLIGFGTYYFNYYNLQKPMNKILIDDYRNEGISVTVHYEYYINPSVLVFNLKEISGSNSRIDVFRVFLQYADRLWDTEFEEVVLQYRGQTKFLLDGDYFSKVGLEYDYQNAAYTMRTFPYHVKSPSGSFVYSRNYGEGMLGGLNTELGNFTDFHDKWYWNDLIRED